MRGLALRIIVLESTLNGVNCSFPTGRSDRWSVATGEIAVLNLSTVDGNISTRFIVQKKVVAVEGNMSTGFKAELCGKYSDQSLH